MDRDHAPPCLRGSGESGLGAIVLAANGLSHRRGDTLGRLLAATNTPPPDAPGTAPGTVWALDNIERAGRIVALLQALDRLDRIGAPYGFGPGAERRAVDRLAAGLRLLNDPKSAAPTPCSATLRYLARDWVELFGPAVGDVSLATDIERLALPALKGRALLLAASTLILDALCAGIAHPGRVGMVVSLHRFSDAYACLSVADDRPPLSATRSGAACAGLVAVLDGHFACRPATGGGTLRDVMFPLIALPPQPRRPR
jgi:hypothetical protein